MIQTLHEFFIGPLHRSDVHLKNHLNLHHMGNGGKKKKLNVLLMLMVMQQFGERSSFLTLVPGLTLNHMPGGYISLQDCHTDLISGISLTAFLSVIMY